MLTRRAADAGDALELMVLRDGEARRQDVIDAFRTHLGEAGPDDTALFYYSGHGAQERTTVPEHLAVEPDGLNETLVLADSRHEDVRDLADKELALLVAEVSRSAGHVALFLDCCHSGSGVRAADEDGIDVRTAPIDDRPRSADEYLAGSVTRDDAATRYVLMAACRPDQTAKEVRVDGTARGAFSVALERALAGIGGTAPMYADLGRWAGAAVRNLAVDQSPVVECPTRDDALLPFLGGVAAPREPTTTASHVRGRGWVLAAGRLQGIAPGTPDAPAGVMLHALGAVDTADGPLTTAAITDVGVATSLLQPADPTVLDETATYRAVVTGVGQPQASVAVRGTGATADAIRAALRASDLVRLADGRRRGSRRGVQERHGPAHPTPGDAAARGRRTGERGHHGRPDRRDRRAHRPLDRAGPAPEPGEPLPAGRPGADRARRGRNAARTRRTGPSRSPTPATTRAPSGSPSSRSATPTGPADPCTAPSWC